MLLKSIMAVTFALTIPKLFVCVIQGLDELRALGVLFWLKFTSQPTEGAMSRGSFLNVLGQGVGILAFLGMGYGITKGKYAYKVRKHLVRHPMLPKALKGCVWCNSVMRIWVRSKAHPEPVLKALEKVNELEPDVILFTGDLVNELADEAEAWVDAFAGLNAPLGKFSVMGNHDYADYGPFTKEERIESIAKLKRLQSQMGFRMLDNEHVVWEKEGEKLVLVGVENWGKGFRQSGDLEKAMAGSGAGETFSMLMSHDPTHFELQIMERRAPVDLTLSGHTHGMQMGIEIPWLGVKWSPSSWTYKRWGGLFGRRSVPAREQGLRGARIPRSVGMPPEITLLTLVNGTPAANFAMARGSSFST